MRQQPDHDPMVSHQAERQRFMIEVNGASAHLDYSIQDNTVDFHHTFTPPALRGLGVAAQLVQAGVNWARQQDLRIHASCSYVAHWLAKEREKT